VPEEDTSLDQFVGSTTSDESEESPNEASADEAESPTDAETAGEPLDSSGSETDADASLGTVEPATSTYEWTPAGAACEACDALVERRWRDDEKLVCADCKEW
jgi:hypothetical protein